MTSSAPGLGSQWFSRQSLILAIGVIVLYSTLSCVHNYDASNGLPALGVTVGDFKIGSAQYRLGASAGLPSPVSSVEAHWGAKALHNDEEQCIDNWKQPGFPWYGKGPRAFQWMPYDYAASFVPQDSATFTRPHEVDYYSIRKQAFSQPPSMTIPYSNYSDMLLDPSSEQNAQSLEFLRDRHVVIIGSSLDREGILYMCREHGQGVFTEVSIIDHRWTICRSEQFNFTVSQWFHFGVHETDWWTGRDKNATKILEERVREHVVPFTEKWGQPDLLMWSSSLWDINYLRRAEYMTKHPDHGPVWETPNAVGANVHFSSLDLEWHRMRLVEVTHFLRRLWPNTPMLYRLATDGREDENWDISIFQLNQSARALMKVLGIPLFNWPELVKGDREFRNGKHYHRVSKVNHIYGEMLLWHVKEVATGRWNPNCYRHR